MNKHQFTKPEPRKHGGDASSARDVAPTDTEFRFRPGQTLVRLAMIAGVSLVLWVLLYILQEIYGGVRILGRSRPEFPVVIFVRSVLLIGMPTWLLFSLAQAFVPKYRAELKDGYLEIRYLVAGAVAIPVASIVDVRPKRLFGINGIYWDVAWKNGDEEVVSALPDLRAVNGVRLRDAISRFTASGL